MITWNVSAGRMACSCTYCVLSTDIIMYFCFRFARGNTVAEQLVLLLLLLLLHSSSDPHSNLTLGTVCADIMHSPCDHMGLPLVSGLLFTSQMC